MADMVIVSDDDHLPRLFRLFRLSNSPREYKG